jgi:hypothetical protein
MRLTQRNSWRKQLLRLAAHAMLNPWPVGATNCARFVYSSAWSTRQSTGGSHHPSPVHVMSMTLAMWPTVLLLGCVAGVQMGLTGLAPACAFANCMLALLAVSQSHGRRVRACCASSAQG